MLTRTMVAKRAFAKKIVVTQPVVDMDGDEMTRIIWKWIKERVSETQPTHLNFYLAYYSICRHQEPPIL